MQLAFKFPKDSEPTAIESNVIEFSIPDSIYSIIEETINSNHYQILFPDIKISKSMKKTLGSYNYKNNQITLSFNLILFGKREEIESVVLHELAHAFTFSEYGPFPPSHGKEFRQICKGLNILPRSYVDVKIHKWKKKFMYLVICKNCYKNIIKKSKLNHLFCECGKEIFPDKWETVVYSEYFNEFDSGLWIRL